MLHCSESHRHNATYSLLANFLAGLFVGDITIAILALYPKSNPQVVFWQLLFLDIKKTSTSTVSSRHSSTGSTLRLRVALKFNPAAPPCPTETTR